jgi:hypothetical protein
MYIGSHPKNGNVMIFGEHLADYLNLLDCTWFLLMATNCVCSTVMMMGFSLCNSDVILEVAALV